MPSYTISKLLKAKTRIISELVELKLLVARSNSYAIGDPDIPPVRQAFENILKLTNDLVKIKTAITKGNTGVQHLIFELSETKGLLSYFQGLNTRRGDITNPGYGNVAPTVTTFDAEIKANEKTQLLETWKARINEIQDELDEYNASTKVEVDVIL